MLTTICASCKHALRIVDSGILCNVECTVCDMQTGCIYYKKQTPTADIYICQDGGPRCGLCRALLDSTAGETCPSCGADLGR